jgi:hypothetical protein
MKNKIGLWGGGVIIIVLVVLGWQMKVGTWFYQTWQERKAVAEVEQIKKAWRNDIFGGATPEETLKMFVTAFKAGDLELASKYFAVDKQAEYLAKMQNWVKLGKEGEITKSLENSKMLGTLREDSFVADMGEVDENNRAISNIEFKLNEFTNKWKLNGM